MSFRFSAVIETLSQLLRQALKSNLETLSAEISFINFVKHSNIQLSYVFVRSIHMSKTDLNNTFPFFQQMKSVDQEKIWIISIHTAKVYSSL